MLIKSRKAKSKGSVARGAFRRVASFRAKVSNPVFLNASQLPTNKRICSLVAHADDLALNAGRTTFALTRKSRHNNFHSFVLMSGQRAVLGEKNSRRRAAIRRVEAAKEAKLLGAKSHFLRLSYYEQKKVSARDVERLSGELEKQRPEILLIPHSMDRSHPDHFFSHKLGVAVAKELVLKTGKPMEVWECGSVWDPIPNTLVNTYALSSARASEAQAKALLVHKSQMSRTPFDKINKAESFKRRMLLGEALAGFGKKPKKIPDADAFIRYKFVRKKGKVMKQEIAA